MKRNPSGTSRLRPRPGSHRSDPVLDALAAELGRLPVRRDAETWDAALAMLPATVREGDAPPFRPLIALCASSEGGLAASDLMSPETIVPTCLLEAIARFALRSLQRDAQPLGYLPARVRIPTRRDPATDLVEKVLVPLGVLVQRTDDLTDFLAAAHSLREHMESKAPSPLPMPGLMTVKGMTLDRVRGCAEAMALYCAAAPWQTLDDEVQWLISPAPKTLAMRTCIVTGALQEQIGLAFLASMEDFEAMHLMPEITGMPYIPSSTLWSVMLEPMDSAPAADIELWHREGLPLCDLPVPGSANMPSGSRPSRKSKPKSQTPAAAATVPAIPLPLGMTPTGRPQRPTPSQLLLMETLLRGFAAASKAELRRESLHFAVQTSAGAKEIFLRR